MGDDEVVNGSSGITRRGAIGVGAALGFMLLGHDLLIPEAAQAAVAWGHPFKFRAIPGERFGAPRPGGRTHEGLDYPALEGTPIYAVANGTVTAKGWLGSGGAYGNACFVAHSDGWESRYAHMTSPAAVAVGNTVTRGQLVGYVGNTGVSSGPHLHIELRLNGTAKDPYPYIQDAPLAGTNSLISLPKEDKDMRVVRRDGSDIFVIGDESIYHVPDPSYVIPLCRVWNGSDTFYELDTPGFAAHLFAMSIPWAAMVDCVAGKAYNSDGALRKNTSYTDGRKWTRRLARGN